MRLKTNLTKENCAKHEVDTDDEFYMLVQRCFQDKVPVHESVFSVGVETILGHADDFRVEDQTVDIHWLPNIKHCPLTQEYYDTALMSGRPELLPMVNVAMVGKIENRKMNIVKIPYCALLHPSPANPESLAA